MSLDPQQAQKAGNSISAPTDTVQTANTERNINLASNDPSAPIARMKFSPTLYSKYKKVEQEKKMMAKQEFKRLIEKITDKKNWKQRWGKIKQFIETNKQALAQLAKQEQSDMDDYAAHEKNQIFTLIMALYAGEDQNEIFGELDQLYEKHPREVEFYIPQLCTYLFHFDQHQIDRRNSDLPSPSIGSGSKRPSQIGQNAPAAEEPNQIVEQQNQQQQNEYAAETGRQLMQQQNSNIGLKEFLIQKSRQNLRFAHMMFWCILSQMDDTQSLQMSRHQKKEVWEVLQLLVESQDQQNKKYKEDDMFKMFQQVKIKNLARISINKGGVGSGSSDDVNEDGSADTGGSAQFTYGHVAGLESHARLVRFDQQLMRAISNNMTQHHLFLSTPKFISDLLFVSEVLKPIEKDERDDYLKHIIGEINKNLPANVYIPIQQTTTNLPNPHIKGKKHIKELVDQKRMHKVLRISTENCFCLHSKERVPYHIIIEVAYDPEEIGDSEVNLSDSSMEKIDQSNYDNEQKEKEKNKSNIQKAEAMLGQGQDLIQKTVDDPEKYKQFVGEVQTTEGSGEQQQLEKNLKLPDSIKQDMSGVQSQQAASSQREFIGAENAIQKSGNGEDNAMPIDNQDIQLEMVDIQNQKVNQIDGIIGSNDKMAQMPATLPVKNTLVEPSAEMEDGNSTDMGYDSNEGGTVGCLACSPCCSGSKNNQQAFKDSNVEIKKPSSLFGTKSFNQVCRETQKTSDYGKVPNYGIVSVIVKSPDNLTQEQFASQLIKKFNTIFETHKLKLWLKPFNIIATCPTGGLIETIPDAVSINQLKKQNPHILNLRQYFIQTFKNHNEIDQPMNRDSQPNADGDVSIQSMGSTMKEDVDPAKPSGTDTTQKKISIKRISEGAKNIIDKAGTKENKYNMARYHCAKQNFMRSMAGYSILCYILQIKDRHNGNILLDSKGHMIHVDFGFMFSNSPGKNMNFESMAFKLTQEYVDILGGQRSKFFNQFKTLMIKGFLALREHAEEIISFVEMSMISGIDLPCFRGRDRVLSELRDRFKLDMTEAQCKVHISNIIEEACDCWRTRWYDKFQKYSADVW